jgi:hypothetical protein
MLTLTKNKNAVSGLTTQQKTNLGVKQDTKTNRSFGMEQISVKQILEHKLLRRLGVSKLDLFHTAIIADCGKASSAGGKFIKWVFKALQKHPDYDSIVVHGFIQFTHDFLHKHSDEVCKGKLPHTTPEICVGLIGQIRIGDEYRSWLNQQFNFNCPKYITFGGIDAYQVPVTDILFEQVYEEITRRNPETARELDTRLTIINTSNAEGLHSPDVRALVEQQLKFEFVLNSFSGLAYNKIDLHVVEGYKKGVFLASQDKLVCY